MGNDSFSRDTFPRVRRPLPAPTPAPAPAKRSPRTTRCALAGAALLAAFAACSTTTNAPGGGASAPDTDMAAVLHELERLDPEPIVRLSPAAARRQPTPADAVIQVLQRRGDLAPEPMPAVGRIETRLVPGSDGVQLPARIYTPAGTGPFPLIVYFHGGGFVLATIDTYDASCRALCEEAGAVVVAVEYRKAPEHKFPTAHEDAHAATQHVLAHAASFGGDPARVAVAGESAGGNLATTVCLMARERGGLMPRHQLLVYPVVGASNDTPSYREHAFAKPLDAAAMEWFYRQYLRTPADRDDTRVSPLLAATSALRGLPPATVITAAIDPLRSEGQAYAARLADAGVAVEARDYGGVAHEFFGMAAVVAKARDAQRFAGQRLREALAGSASAPRDATSGTTGRDGPAEASAPRARAPAGQVVRGGAAVGQRDARLEELARFDGPAMPTGVTVSRSGRVFVCFPRWSDPVEHTVVELRDGRQLPFPDAATNAFRPERAQLDDVGRVLVNVQSVVVDERDTLWLLDSGSVELGPVLPGAPKLWGYDLATNELRHRITFPNDVVLKKTYLNDVRFDRDRGLAYITDSGAGGIVVVDLDSGRSWRHLDDSPATRPTPGVRLTNEGDAFLVRRPDGEQAPPDIRADGIALSPDRATLYFTPLMSRDLYAVPTALLADRDADPARVATAVRKVATKPSANDGLLCDRSDGSVYSTDWEDAAIRRTDPRTGASEVVVQDERLVWPDTLAWGGSDLYVMTNQLARQPRFHAGTDERSPPYVLFRLRSPR